MIFSWHHHHLRKVTANAIAAGANELKRLVHNACLSYGDFCSVSCSVAFISCHTNSFDDAQVIISQPAGSTFIMPLVVPCVFGVFGFFFVCFLFVCFVFCLSSVFLSAS